MRAGRHAAGRLAMLVDDDAVAAREVVVIVPMKGASKVALRLQELIAIDGSLIAISAGWAPCFGDLDAGVGRLAARGQRPQDREAARSGGFDLDGQWLAVREAQGDAIPFGQRGQVGYVIVESDAG